MTALVMVAALLAAGCGRDEEPSDPAVLESEPPERAEGATAPRPETREEAAPGEPLERRRGDARPPASREGPVVCSYTAPEGRLAEPRLTIALDGVACDEAVPLAKAAALGQPAGANLTLSRDGFRCEPSTAEKGVNTTYTCVRGSNEASFEVLWTAPG